MSEENKLDLSVVGYSGLKQYGGIIDEEWAPKLKGQYGPKVYREMSDSSSTIGAIMFAIESLVRQVEWRVEPAAKDFEAQEWARFVEECMLDMDDTFEDLMSEILSCLTYGWAYFEIVYKMRKGSIDDKSLRSRYDDGRIGIRSIALRPQDTLDHWEFDKKDDSLLGMHQYDEATGKTAFIPIEKAVLFRTKNTKNNPEGRSLFRNAVSDYYYFKRIYSMDKLCFIRELRFK
jgi:phage gp29-like protein